MELREMRELAGLTQRQLASLCPGINNTRICLAEAGLKLRPEEECAIRSALLQIIEARAVQISRALSSREAVAV
jgi:DNA-binding XRE family transcriptional regulator